MELPRYEKIWLITGSITLVIFLVLLGIMGFAMGFNPSGHMKTIAPDQVGATPPFDKPGLFTVADKEYRAVMQAKVFAFLPGEMTIPAGSKIHFEVTSPDVVHGMYIAGTNVNMMIVPGHISEFTHTFNKPGDYLILCNEYCGSGHHLMLGRIIVQ
ncbi:cytochrome c oxidase subunit II [Ferviditalea candida]|uniref:Cytochrome aa3 subunit 2 n=1 Tax=Ferviditalea candida TaxID=3108399 RepID=A0ABU5ZFY8_9BACL|nr:cytochrome c oxidase subunit II [Paenibacillaceae bacterium T2]